MGIGLVTSISEPWADAGQYSLGWAIIRLLFRGAWVLMGSPISQASTPEVPRRGVSEVLRSLPGTQEFVWS